MNKIHAIIPAGGSGTRLWPISTPKRPKFLLPITDPTNSLLQLTVGRLRKLAQGITIVTGTQYSSVVSAQVGDICTSKEFDVIAEPSPRDSMAAIGIAAAIVHARNGNTLVGSFAADQVITNREIFESCVEQAAIAAEAGYLTTIGISPTAPSTGFGYIRLTGKAGEDRPALDSKQAGPAQVVESFVEKPDAATAKRYFRSGNYLWNAGMFVASTEMLLDSLRQLHSEMFRSLNAIAEAWDTPHRQEVLLEQWETLPKMPIDTALAEPLAAVGKVAVVAAPTQLGWDDMGDYQALYRLHADKPESGAINLNPTVDVVTIDSPGGLISVPGVDSVAVVGIPDAVVIMRSGQLLVTTLEHAQRVKDVVGKFPPKPGQDAEKR